MTSKATWMMVVLFVILINSKCNKASDSDLSKEEELEFERQLKLLNKPPITTFETKEGDIIDCVDINKQPALDHPSLSNHKVQTRPNGYPNDWLEDSSQPKHNSLLFNRQPCPLGFVPIRRTLKKDLIRLRSLSLKKATTNMNDMKDNAADGVGFPYNQNVVSLSMKKGKYYGANGHVSVYNLSVAQDQSSSANIWIVGGPYNALNVILAGWQVNPAINGDSLTRLFVYWTADGGAKTGCYNMLCQGFVQTHQSITPNLPLSPASIYRGAQYDYEFVVYQDRSSGNWWLLLKEDRIAIGYWPKELFGYLNDGAEQVAWGGIARPSPNEMSPPLGNGHMPNGQYNEACYFRNINYIDGAYTSQAPLQQITSERVSNSKCYGLDNNIKCGNIQFAYCFTFGGPGGSNCAGFI